MKKLLIITILILFLLPLNVKAKTQTQKNDNNKTIKSISIQNGTIKTKINIKGQDINIKTPKIKNKYVKLINIGF